MTARRALAAGLAVALACVAAPAAGQDVAVVGATVFPVSSPPIKDATVLVRDGRVVAVGRRVEVPDGVERIDATGKTVTPGLFDPASTIGLVEVDLVSQTRDESAAGAEDQIVPAFDPLDGLNPNSTLIPWSRTHGLTATATRPTGGLVSGQAAVIRLVGRTPEEMVVRRGAAMMAAFDESGARAAGGARGMAALRLREVLEDARFWREHRADFDRGRSRELAQSRLDMAALQPVLDGTMPLIVEAQRASDILAVLRIAEEYGIRPVILGGAEAWMVADRLAAADVPVILKPLTSSPREFERIGARFDNAALLTRAGVRVAISPFDSHRAPSITQEAGNAVRFGMPWEAALRAITLTPAEIYGVADRMGSIQPGREADLVIWSGDPFETSSEAETVLVRGRPVPDWSRQKELLERYRSLTDTPRPAYDGGGGGS